MDDSDISGSFLIRRRGDGATNTINTMPHPLQPSLPSLPHPFTHWAHLLNLSKSLCRSHAWLTPKSCFFYCRFYACTHLHGICMPIYGDIGAWVGRSKQVTQERCGGFSKARIAFRCAYGEFYLSEFLVMYVLSIFVCTHSLSGESTQAFINETPGPQTDRGPSLDWCVEGDMAYGHKSRVRW